MKKNTILIGFVILVLGLGAGYALRGNFWGAYGSHMMQDGSQMKQNIDQHFIVQMIPHHEGAIAMAKIALNRSKRPEIISLSKGIIEAQEREIVDMKAWHKEWFNSEVSDTDGSGMGGMHMDSMSGDVSVLNTVSDAEFDREFISQMIPHHEMAVTMAQMLQSGTSHDEMKQLADNIITSQSSEIKMMRSWLNAWY